MPAGASVRRVSGPTGSRSARHAQSGRPEVDTRIAPLAQALRLQTSNALLAKTALSVRNHPQTGNRVRSAQSARRVEDIGGARYARDIKYRQLIVLHASSVQLAARQTLTSRHVKLARSARLETDTWIASLALAL